MAKRKTVAELERTIRSLEPAQEALTCLLLDIPITRIECGELSIDAVGLERASGGVALRVNGRTIGAEWLFDVITRLRRHHDVPYRELANTAMRLSEEAAHTRRRA